MYYVYLLYIDILSRFAYIDSYHKIIHHQSETVNSANEIYTKNY